jgi:predicted metal-dependent peptidase
MSNEDILSTLGEVQHVCKMTRTNADLIQVDTEPFPPEKITAKTKTIQRKAAGGTYLAPAIEMAKQHNIDYQAVVVLTDGGLFGDDISRFEELNKKVIWLVSEHGSVLSKMDSGKMQSFQLKSS